jgi:hypothetical protein
MAFADTLGAESQVTVIFVYRHDRPDGDISLIAIRHALSVNSLSIPRVSPRAARVSNIV